MSTTTQAPAVAEVAIATHTCEVGWLSAWKTKVDKVNRKAIRNGLKPYVLTVTGRETKSRKNGLGLLVTWDEVTFDIVGDIPALPVWSFAATLDWEEGGCIVRTSPAWKGGPLPRPEDRSCDHCKTSRSRRTTYLVAGPDGAIKHV